MKTFIAKIDDKRKVEVSIEGKDRELEFFTVKEDVDNIIKNFLKEAKNTESCEIVAEYILDWLEIKYDTRKIKIKIFEDNKNRAEINNYNRF